MITRWHRNRGVAALAAVMLLAAVVVGCDALALPEPPEVAGARQIPTPTPRPASPTAVPTAEPTAEPTPAATATPMPGAPVPRATAQALRNPYSQLEQFQGLIQVTTYPDTPEALHTFVRQWYKKPNRAKVQVVRSDSARVSVGTTLIYDGGGTIFYDPSDDRVVRIEDPAQTALFLSLPMEGMPALRQVLQLQQFLATAAAEATMSAGGMSSVANRDAVLLNITPKAALARIQGVRLWLDDITGAPLKIEGMGQGDRVLVRMEFAFFDRLTQFPDDAFAFTPSTRARVQRPQSPHWLGSVSGLEDLSLREAQGRVGFPILQPASLPPDVTLQSIRFGESGGSPVVVLFYGTPDETTALLVERTAGPRPPLLRTGDLAEVGGSAAEVSESQGVVVVDWRRGPTGLTLATVLGRDEALPLAGSVR